MSRWSSESWFGNVTKPEDLKFSAEIKGQPTQQELDDHKYLETLYHDLVDALDKLQAGDDVTAAIEDLESVKERLYGMLR